MIPNTHMITRLPLRSSNPEMIFRVSRIRTLLVILALSSVLALADSENPPPEKLSIQERITQGLVDYGSAEDRRAVQGWLVDANFQKKQALEEREALNKEAVEMERHRARLLESNASMQKNTDKYLYQEKQIARLGGEINELLSESGQKMMQVTQINKAIRLAEEGLRAAPAPEDVDQP